MVKTLTHANPGNASPQNQTNFRGLCNMLQYILSIYTPNVSTIHRSRHRYHRNINYFNRCGKLTQYVPCVNSEGLPHRIVCIFGAETPCDSYHATILSLFIILLFLLLISSSLYIYILFCVILLYIILCIVVFHSVINLYNSC